MSPRGGKRPGAGRPRKSAKAPRREQWTFVPDEATRAAVEAYRSRAMPGASTAAVVRALVMLGARAAAPSGHTAARPSWRPMTDSELASTAIDGPTGLREYGLSLCGMVEKITLSAAIAGAGDQPEVRAQLDSLEAERDRVVAEVRRRG